MSGDVLRVTVGGGLLAGLVVVLVLAGPWLLFWSVGVLFGVHVPLTFNTWLAAVVLLLLVRGGSS